MIILFRTKKVCLMRKAKVKTDEVNPSRPKVCGNLYFFDVLKVEEGPI